MPRITKWGVVTPVVERVFRGEISHAEAAAELGCTLQTLRRYLPVVQARKAKAEREAQASTSSGQSSGDSRPRSGSPSSAELPGSGPGSPAPAGGTGTKEPPKSTAASAGGPSLLNYRGGLKPRKSGTSGPRTTKSGTGEKKREDLLDFLD